MLVGLPAGARYVSFLAASDRFEIHPVNYLVGTEFISPGKSEQRHEADYSHPFNTERLYLRSYIRLQ
jgi:hypothetical protein